MVKLDPVLFSLVHEKGEDNYDSMAWDEVFKRFIRQTIKSCNINTSTQKADYYILCEILLLELLIAWILVILWRSADKRQLPGNYYKNIIMHAYVMNRPAAFSLANEL